MPGSMGSLPAVCPSKTRALPPENNGSRTKVSGKPWPAPRFRSARLTLARKFRSCVRTEETADLQLPAARKRYRASRARILRLPCVAAAPTLD